MSDIAIRVEDISKLYKIGVKSHDTIKDLLASSLNGFFRRPTTDSEIRNSQSKPSPVPGLPSADGSQSDFIWALKDVSFDVKQGETLGIIGANGAGKSTLLKILSRITEPTSGRAEVYGRVGSLLEVGTGFDRELTGRENIYLNGAVLGMKKAEIDRKFDEIVDFSGVEKFIDTPIKRYSSGMYVRLAFAVAAHLEPEILIVDEVLAVGDATFQKKCIDRMSELAARGRTVLFVSHNMEMIPRLCSKVILLEHGQIRMEGEPKPIIEEYLAKQQISENGDNLASTKGTGDGRARFTRLEKVDSEGNPRPSHPCGEDLVLRIQIVSEYDLPDVALAVVLKTLSGFRIITSWTREVGFAVDLHKGVHTYQCRFREVKLRPGHSVSVSLWMEAQGEVIDYVENAGTIQVIDGEQTRNLSTEGYQGIVVCDYEWSQA